MIFRSFCGALITAALSVAVGVTFDDPIFSLREIDNALGLTTVGGQSRVRSWRARLGMATCAEGQSALAARSPEGLRFDQASQTASEADKKAAQAEVSREQKKKIPFCRIGSSCICGNASSAHRTIHLAFLFAILTQRSPHLSTIVKCAQITRC